MAAAGGGRRAGTRTRRGHELSHVEAPAQHAGVFQQRSFRTSSLRRHRILANEKYGLAIVVGSTGLSLFLTPACAIRNRRIDTYRLVSGTTGPVLIPPGVRLASISRRTVLTDVPAGNGTCTQSATGIKVRQRDKRIRLTVEREALTNRPAGWLNRRAAELEAERCIAQGTAWRLAEDIANAVALGPNVPFHLLHSDQLDVTPQMRIQVVSPILREPGPPNAMPPDPGEPQARDGITLTMRAPPNLAGYEVGWYLAQQRPDGGLRVVPLSAERHIFDGATEKGQEPSFNWFNLSPQAEFYRVFYKAHLTDYTELIIAASTSAELERESEAITAGAGSCETLDRGRCVAIPKDVAINGFLPVTINRAVIMVPWRATVGQALRQAGERNPSAILPKMRIYRINEGKPVALTFGHSHSAVLGLTITGGEIISWE